MQSASEGVLPVRRARAAARWRGLRLADALERFRLAILVYLGSRALLLVVAIVDGALRHHSILNELANWDGLWYRELANKGYPHHVIHCCTGNGSTHAESTLGFFPLYPLIMWVGARAVMLVTSHGVVYSLTLAGVIVSMVGGLVTTVLVQQLAAGWWGEAAGRRAALVFCLFPGSVVFSMVYAEGVALPLAAGCILALARRRWVLAGILAGLATATEPEALVLIPVCALSAGLELRRRGWRVLAARRSLLAPVLSLSGAVTLGAFLWAWAGTPFATVLTQRYGWRERTDPLALVHLTTRLARQISFAHLNHPTINLNLVVGLGGAIVLLGLLVLVFRARRTISVEAIAWTIGISFLAVTSEYTPPNPRLLITAFPAVIVLAYYLRGKRFGWLLAGNAVLLAGLSALTFVGITLRP